MNKLFDIPKMRIVVISAAVVVTLAVITVTVACLKVNAPTGDKDAVDAMVSVSESDTEPPVSEIPETETEKIPDDEEGLLYQNNGNGTCTVVGIGTCTKTEITLPEKSPGGLRVVAISTGAFENCDKIVSIHIPASVRDIGTGAFVGCKSLTTFTVETTNTEYCAVGSVLFSKDKTELVCYPAKRVGQNYLLSTNVTRISPYAFDGVSTLSKLLYRGTISQFQNITIGTGNSIFTKMPIEFNYNALK
ncbi:MAG: leucine-rich repeat protein [Clostridia bacterium]|nr:leucine-rich repeat protein [Clostridia bacterium]